jgi:hypothetical protein
VSLTDCPRGSRRQSVHPASGIPCPARLRRPGHGRGLDSRRARAEARRAQTRIGGHERCAWPGGVGADGPGAAPFRPGAAGAVRLLRSEVTPLVWGGVPVATPGGVHGFPAALTSFTGRDGSLREVAGLLAARWWDRAWRSGQDPAGRPRGPEGSGPVRGRCVAGGAGAGAGCGAGPLAGRGRAGVREAVSRWWWHALARDVCRGGITVWPGGTRCAAGSCIWAAGPRSVPVQGAGLRRPGRGRRTGRQRGGRCG